MRRLVAAALLLIVATQPTSAQRLRLRLRSWHSVPTSQLLLSDLGCVGMFLGPNINTGNFSVTNPTAIQMVGNTPHIFQFDGASAVTEYLTPTLSPCNTALASINQASVLQSWGNWPTLHSGDNNGWVPRSANTSQSFAWGLKWDDPNGWLVLSHASAYNSLVAGTNAIAAASLDTGSHTLSCVGEWGVTGLKQSAIGTGIIDIPSTFRTTYGLGSKRWGLGTGGYISSGSNGPTANSIGLAIRATDVPAGNACPNATDTDIAEGTTLVRYDINPTGVGGGTGPTCGNVDGDNTDLSGSHINCVAGSGTPAISVAPTPDYAQQIAFTKYSSGFYNFFWDPYQGHGYVGSTAVRGDWYNGVKQGIVQVLSHPDGGVNTTVLASPAPTVDCSGAACVGTFSIDPSVLTGPHRFLQVGDKAWVQTCTPIIYNNPADQCAADNGRYLSTVGITSINNATGAIGVTYQDTDGDGSVGTHVAVVGGHFYMGGVYAHGGPDNSREIDLIQIINPTQLGEVVNSTRAHYNVIYNEEAEFSTFAAPFGCPGCVVPGKRKYEQTAFPLRSLANQVSDVHALPSIHRIYVAFRSNVGLATQTLFVVLSVTE